MENSSSNIQQNSSQFLNVIDGGFW
jgi:hypothetical protein